jgi:hypothetical protein
VTNFECVFDQSDEVDDTFSVVEIVLFVMNSVVVILSSKLDLLSVRELEYATVAFLVCPVSGAMLLEKDSVVLNFVLNLFDCEV